MISTVETANFLKAGFLVFFLFTIYDIKTSMGLFMKDVKEYNSKAWDSEVLAGENIWTKPVSSEEIELARSGEFSIILTPNIPVPRDWFPADLKGVDILCLASGGGQQVPVLAALGANVTSFDNSAQQLNQDKFVAERDGLEIRLEKGDATDLSRFADESFDLIWHP